MLTEFPFGKRLEPVNAAGFSTHTGCNSSCVYCPDANSGVSFRDIKDVINEIKCFTEKGVGNFIAADPEFNEDLEYSLEFCEALKKSGLRINWTVSMKPANYNQKLFRLMKQTGVNLVKLRIDSFKKCPLYWNDTEKIVFITKSCRIKTEIDFVTGFPYEDEELLIWCLDLFRRIQPDKVNIKTFIRLYDSLQLTRIIRDNPQLMGNLVGNIDGPAFEEPAFYNHIDTDRLIKLIDSDRLFAIARPDPAVLSQTRK